MTHDTATTTDSDDMPSPLDGAKPLLCHAGHNGMAPVRPELQEYMAAWLRLAPCISTVPFTGVNTRSALQRFFEEHELNLPIGNPEWVHGVTCLFVVGFKYPNRDKYTTKILAVEADQMLLINVKDFDVYTGYLSCMSSPTKAKGD